jgi:hypothetical protein
MPTSASRLLSLYPHLTPRDRHLLQLLDDHQVFTTSQVHRMLFHAQRTCQIRLSELRALDLVDRFRFHREGGGTQPWHWVLGLNGARFQSARHAQPAPTDRHHHDRIQRLSVNPHLAHLLHVNEFFIRLHAHARTDPTVGLHRWWSERTATAKFINIRPDGHGLWGNRDDPAGFFIEADLGTEPIWRLTAKLPAYAKLAREGGPRYPVLFWLPNTDREAHLHLALRAEPGPVPIATATHDAAPHARVWLPGGDTQRAEILELPNDHGPQSARNPNWRDGYLDLAGD